MRFRTITPIAVVHRLLLAVLFAIPFYTSYVAFGAYVAAEQADMVIAQSVAIAVPIASEPSSVAPETTQPTQASPVSSQAAPTATATSTAAPAAPAPKQAAPAVDRIVIPSIGLNSQLVAVGLTSDGAIDVHPRLAGWWNGSAQPGTPGAAFIDGHTPGVLSSLANIGVEAQIAVQKADGQVFTYSVVYREIVPLANVNMRKALSVYGGASEGLNIMTCAGTYIPSMNTTDQRLIVYAVRV